MTHIKAAPSGEGAFYIMVFREKRRSSLLYLSPSAAESFDFAAYLPFIVNDFIA